MDNDGVVQKDTGWVVIQAMNKDLRALTLRMQKFRKVIQAFNVCISSVPGIHNKISNALSRAPVVGPEGTERVLSNLRGHASMPTTG